LLLNEIIEEGVLIPNTINQLSNNLLNTPKPRYCIKKCGSCQANCKYEFDELKNLGQVGINKELKLHFHPTCRIMDNGKQRITTEGN